MIRASQDRYRSHRWPEPDDLRVLNDSVPCTIVPSRRHGPAGMGPEGQRQQVAGVNGLLAYLGTTSVFREIKRLRLDRAGLGTTSVDSSGGPQAFQKLGRARREGEVFGAPAHAGIDPSARRCPKAP
jgi:hypothetical protein